jgi:prepilin-type N-terminal cleavage/methylation domain-containing protein
MRKRNGFSLIEIIVVVSVMGFILTSITTVLVNSFKAKNKISWGDKVEQNGAWILSEIRKNVVNISGSDIGYNLTDRSYITVINTGTTIRCFDCLDYTDSRIASESALNIARLSGEEVEVCGCPDFITVTASTSTGKVESLKIGFSLSAGQIGGDPSDYVSKYFSSEIKIRN